MSGRVGFLALIICQLFFLFAENAQHANQSHDSQIVAQPKPAVNPTAGTWKYRSRIDIPGNPHAVTVHSTFSVTIKDDGGSWTVTTAWEFPEGPVTDVLTLDKGTLVVRKESFTHFLHPKQPWKPVEVNLDFTSNTVTGSMHYVSGQDKPVAASLSGPLFAVSAIDLTAGCLPLADGYSTSFRYFDIERLALDPQAPDREKQLQLKVAGAERVTVPAGTFDSYKVELTSTDGAYKETLWIAKDTRVPVKTYTIQVWRKGARKNTDTSATELVP